MTGQIIRNKYCFSLPRSVNWKRTLFEVVFHLQYQYKRFGVAEREPDDSLFFFFEGSIYSVKMK